MQQIDDFRTEVAELAAILAPLPESAWATPTQFKTYTIADLVRHLHQGDHMALTSAERPAEFEALLAERRKKRAAGLTLHAEARELFGHLDPQWRAPLDRAITVLKRDRLMQAETASVYIAGLIEEALVYSVEQSVPDGLPIEPVQKLLFERYQYHLIKREQQCRAPAG